MNIMYSFFQLGHVVANYVIKSRQYEILRLSTAKLQIED